MANKIYKGPCPVCGVYTERKASSWLTFRCEACGLEAAVRAAYEMSTRSGPAWDTFCKSRGALGRPKRTEKRE